MVQICRKWRLLSSSADMMLRASDSLQVTATWSICEQLLQRLQAAGWNPLNRHLPNITANINTAHPHHGPRIRTAHMNACTRGDAITVPTAHLFYGSPLHQGLCTWYGGRRGMMMMGYLSDWISGFKLRSDLWTFAHQGWSGRSRLCSNVDKWQWHHQKWHFIFILRMSSNKICNFINVLMQFHCWGYWNLQLLHHYLGLNSSL